MQEFSLKHIKCVSCKGKLELEVLHQTQEINEGFLYCKKCKLKYPIISKIPILRSDLVSYLSNRSKLGGQLYLKANHKKMKLFVKKSLSKIKKFEDKTGIEERWTRIYRSNKNVKFYSIIRDKLSKLPKSKLSLEHGCSIGTISNFMAKNSDIAFGIDNSFSAISAAKKNQTENLDFFVADSLEHPFGNQKFGLVVALNLLELIEPKELVKIVSKQTKGTFVLSDPYDYDRGKFSVKNPVSPQVLREELQKHGFRISSATKKPSFIPWNLHLNPRTRLNYNVDLVVCKK
ncbi:MAG: methyltransferase domain-containing protein [Nitrosopumilaceae archaeon]